MIERIEAVRPGKFIGSHDSGTVTIIIHLALRTLSGKSCREAQPRQPLGCLLWAAGAEDMTRGKHAGRISRSISTGAT